METLRHLLENSSYSILTALILGLMTAISPCPMATNITAIGFLSRDIQHRQKVFLSGIAYMSGRAFSYTLLAIILSIGASKLKISMIFQGWGEKLIGPLLIVIGLVMLDVLKINFPGFSKLTESLSNSKKGIYWRAFLLGSIFALAFCPYSGVLYFTMLIPLTFAKSGGIFLPFIYAFGTSLPVIIFAWIFAYTFGNLGVIFNQLKTIELYIRRVVAVIFILSGLYTLIRFFV